MKIKTARNQITPLVPLAVAEGVWDEASLWLGEALPRRWILFLAHKSRVVSTHNPRFRRLLSGSGSEGRDWLWAFMRHWLAALLHKHRTALYARLPNMYKVGAAIQR